MPFKDFLDNLPLKHGNKQAKEMKKKIKDDQNVMPDGMDDAHHPKSKRNQKKLVVTGFPDKENVAKKRQAWDEKLSQNADRDYPTGQKRFKSQNPMPLATKSKATTVVKCHTKFSKSQTKGLAATSPRHGLPKPSMPGLPRPVHVPGMTDYNECNWDLSSLAEEIEQLKTKPLPFGVHDIDRLETDYFNSPNYAKDIINYLKTREKLHRCDMGVWDQDAELNTNVRGILVDWLIQVQEHLGLDEATLHGAVTLVDRFQMRFSMSLSKFQLLGVTAIFIAAKVYERFAPEVDLLIHLTNNTYIPDDILYMEKFVLRVMDFSVISPVSVDFLYRFLMIESSSSKMQHMNEYILDLCLHDAKSMAFLPSVRAASSVYLSRRLLLASADLWWTASLEYHTGYKLNHLLLCVHRFLKLLSRVSDSKFEGATKKYSSQKSYGNISDDQSLSSSNLVAHLHSLRGYMKCDER